MDTTGGDVLARALSAPASRRRIVRGAGALAVGAALSSAAARGHARAAQATPARCDEASVVNDVHSQLNATCVHRIVRPASVEDVRAAILAAAAEDRAVSVAGGRHATGGQQFAAGSILLDMEAMDRIVAFDAARGEVEVEAGIQWPALMEFLATTQRGQAQQWGIIQKQSGADRFSLGGALSANIHGHGLALKPIISDIVAFTLVDAAGHVLTCSRDQNADLFRLAIGGYGLFGVITTVRLRLSIRQKLVRTSEPAAVADLVVAFERRAAAGALYGDYQFAIDPASDDFLHDGVLSTYRPLASGTAPALEDQAVSPADWLALIYLAHVDKRRAVDAYAAATLAASGQVVWSDLHQMSDYVDGYHRVIDEQIGAATPSTETIGEVYVPRAALPQFLEEVRDDFRSHGVDLIYGSVRLIERDDESFLAWAWQPWACIIFNLHTVHDAAGISAAAAAFRRLYELAIGHGGSYYLTYHRWAARDQVEAAHPRFIAFLKEKLRLDPAERFQSDWYRHYRSLFAEQLSFAPGVHVPTAWT